MTLEEVKIAINCKAEDCEQKAWLSSKTPFGGEETRYFDGWSFALGWVLDLLDTLDGEDDGK